MKLTWHDRLEAGLDAVAGVPAVGTPAIMDLNDLEVVRARVGRGSRDRLEIKGLKGKLHERDHVVVITEKKSASSYSVLHSTKVETYS